MNQCIECNKETKNPKFCSRSCSATANNHLTPKRGRKDRYCKYCNTKLDVIRQRRPTVCPNCMKNGWDWSVVTIKELRATHKYSLSHHAQIRGRARQAYRKNNKKISCDKCGYTKHTQICHIKPVSSYSDDTPIAIINDTNNLIQLCPNCHWELDHPEKVAGDSAALSSF